MPTAYGLGGYDAVVSPMSLALGWGLALSTLVTLLLVPTLYTLAGDLRGLGFRAGLAALRGAARGLAPNGGGPRTASGDR
jgi:hypothetical protein